MVTAVPVLVCTQLVRVFVSLCLCLCLCLCLFLCVQQSKRFQKSSGKIKTKTWFQNNRICIYVTGVCLLAALIISLIIVGKECDVSVPSALLEVVLCLLICSRVTLMAVLAPLTELLVRRFWGHPNLFRQERDGRKNLPD